MGFLDTGNDLTANGTVGVGGVDEVEVMRGDSGGKFGAGEENAGALFFAEGEVFLDISEGGDTVFELPFGRVPIVRGYVVIGPVTWGGGGEGDIAQTGVKVEWDFEMSKCGVCNGGFAG